MTAPVCSPCRSALITGCYQTTIGAHHHRSGRGTQKIHLTGGVVPVPVLFQQAGYYTCIGGPLGEGTVKPGKTDYNFEWDPSMYDGADWSGASRASRSSCRSSCTAASIAAGDAATDDAWAKRVRRELGSRPTPRT